jgi:hypothetical protein
VWLIHGIFIIFFLGGARSGLDRFRQIFISSLL